MWIRLGKWLGSQSETPARGFDFAPFLATWVSMRLAVISTWSPEKYCALQFNKLVYHCTRRVSWRGTQKCTKFLTWRASFVVWAPFSPLQPCFSGVCGRFWSHFQTHEHTDDVADGLSMNGLVFSSSVQLTGECREHVPFTHDWKKCFESGTHSPCSKLE